ncbi:hypothetical protein ETB97_008859 [Aspergillus alliaceus]|uniref:Uncharacterized protein n=1 Tax=Petromyces alliaceus TaxID=209559 RepID=A0A8H5ZUU6_PETAA|nr:hypothetical protein ETB97_008859 [Aspergillus burnettii]
MALILQQHWLQLLTLPLANTSGPRPRAKAVSSPVPPMHLDLVLSFCDLILLRASARICTLACYVNFVQGTVFVETPLLCSEPSHQPTLVPASAMEVLEEYGIIQVYRFRGDLRRRRRARCDDVPLALFPSQVLELGQDTALVVYRDEEAAAVGADPGQVRRAVEEGGPLVENRILESPLRPDMLGLRETAKWLSLAIYPSALEWSSVGHPSTPVVRLQPEAYRSLRYAIFASGTPSCSIDFGDWYVDGGLQTLPRLPTTLKELEVENLQCVFSRPVPPITVPPSSESYQWAQELYTKLRFLQRLKLVDCRCPPSDVANLREWLPNLSIFETRRRSPATFVGLQSEWAHHKCPMTSAELISRSTLLRHPGISHIILSSLEAVISRYLRTHRYENCLRVLPWAALAGKYKQWGLVARVEAYCMRFAEKKQLLHCLSWLTTCRFDSICRALAYFVRLTRQEVITLGFYVLGEFRKV